MSSCGNEVSKWSLRHIRRIAEPIEPVDLPNYTNRFSLEKPISGIGQCVHIPGKADSAYSSFSGGSNIPEGPIPSCYNEGDSLPLEHLPYMDSGYIKGIYNPIAINEGFRQMQDNKTMELSRHTKLDSSSYSRPYGNNPTHEMLYQLSSPVARFPHPSSSPPQIDCYNISRNVEPTHSGIHSVHTEQYTYKDLPFGSLTNCYDDSWLPRSKNESPVGEEHDIWYATNQYTTKKSNSPIVTKPCLMFQEFLTPGSLAKTQMILCAQNSVHTYKIPEEINSKSSPTLHVSYNAVNDTQANKQCFYACSVHKPPFIEAELPSTKPVPGKPKGQLHPVLHLLEVDDNSCLDQNRGKSCLSLKYTDFSPPNEAALEIINSSEDRNPCFSSEGETSREVWQPLLKQQTRMQKPLSHSLDVGETPLCEVYDTANPISYYKPENCASQMLNGFRKAKESDNHHSPDLLVNPRQEEMLKPIHFPKQKFSEKAMGQSQDDSANIKINRKTTPLLYYLSGGKNSNVMSHRNLAQEQNDFAIKSSRSNYPVSAEPIEIPRDSNNCVNDSANKNEGLILGSPASSLDEKFKNDYREKLKVAQRKVLRETSFKRKDLQMSLPVRLKQKTSSRPSLCHLRSQSLSSTNEDSKLISSPKPLETISNKEESKRPQTIRIGGRKRATKEQKKFSFSEPEKLNQLDDQRDQSVAWTKQNARSRSDEINQEDTKFIRSKALENQDRALSKVELKQIQHNALLEYMERKTGQRPAIPQNNPQQKPTLQSRPSSSKQTLEDNPTSNLASSRKLQHIDVPYLFPAQGRILEHLAFLSSLTSTAEATGISGLSSTVSETTTSKVQSSVSEGNWTSKNPSTKILLRSGASVSSKIQGRSKSTSSPMQDIYQSTACPAFLAQDYENYHTDISNPFPEKEECNLRNKHGESGEENNASANSYCLKMAPELSKNTLVSFSEERSNKDSQLKKEICEQSHGSNASMRTQWQQLEANDVIHPLDNWTYCFTSQTGNQEGNSNSYPLVNAITLHNKYDHRFPAQDATLSTAEPKSPEDQRCEDLATEIVAKDKSLVDILMPQPIKKTALDLMESLFPASISMLNKSCRKKGRISKNDQRSRDGATDPSQETNINLGQRAEDAIFHLNQVLRKNVGDSDNITSKKKELISSISLKLQTLWDERELIQSEVKEHTVHGKELESMVQELCKPNEYERYMMFIGDLEKVVNLLLCLSFRLARVQNAMEKTDENTDAEEKQSLNERHRLLSRQREDAKDLKENLDRRERVVSSILSKYITESQLQDFRHFVQAKISLLIEQKHLEEQIKFLEEQLERLEKSISP